MLAAESSNSVSELASCPRQSKVGSIRLSKSPPSLWVGSAVPADTLQNDYYKCWLRRGVRREYLDLHCPRLVTALGSLGQNLHQDQRRERLSTKPVSDFTGTRKPKHTLELETLWTLFESL